MSLATPSSVAFSTSQSVCVRFTGAKASQTSGIASGSRVRRSTDSAMRFLPASAIRASHSPELPSNSSSFRALAEPHHIAEIIGLPGVQIDAHAFTQLRAHEQAREAFRRPGGRSGHGRRLAVVAGVRHGGR